MVRDAGTRPGPDPERAKKMDPRKPSTRYDPMLGPEWKEAPGPTGGRIDRGGKRMTETNMAPGPRTGSGDSRESGKVSEVPKKSKKNRYREREDRTRVLVARTFAVLTGLAGATYLAWLIPALNFEHPVVATVFFVAELFCLGLFLLSALNTWTVRFKPRKGLEADEPYSVDVLVTACDEPIHVVRETLQAVRRLEWKGELNRYLLDDGGSDELERICDDLGIQYLSRPKAGIPGEDAKAGNLNYGLERTSGELVFTLDADQVARSDALRPLAGYMRFPSVAFVQSKQSFRVPEDDPFNSRDPVFYDAVQLAFDADDSVIACGSGVLYRRKALEDIGGFARWNLVEDLTTSYELHSKGWKSLYYPFSVTVGLAPSNISEVYRQRSQWALDSMRLFIWDNPLFKQGLSWRQRLNHLTIGVSYLWSGFMMPVFFVIPIWTYLTGNRILVDREVEVVILRVVYFILFALAAKYLFRDRKPAKQFHFLAGLFPVYLKETIRALFYPPGRKPGYRTNNGRERTKEGMWTTLGALIPQITLLAANALLPFYAILAGVASPWVLAVNIGVSAFALWTLWPVVFESIRQESFRARAEEEMEDVLDPGLELSPSHGAL